MIKWYAQYEVNQEESVQNDVDWMKKGADPTGKVMSLSYYRFRAAGTYSERDWLPIVLLPLRYVFFSFIITT